MIVANTRANLKTKLVPALVLINEQAPFLIISKTIKKQNVVIRFKMKNALISGTAIRLVELLSSVIPPSSIALIAPSSSAARELSNLCASIFQIGSGVSDLKILSPSGLFRLAHEEGLRVCGSAALRGGFPRIATHFESRSALYAALSSGSLPLDAFQPANARFKNSDALHRFFNELQRSGISPEFYESAQIAASKLQSAPRGALASAMAAADNSRRAELSSAYRSWMDIKRKEGVLDMPEIILNTLQTLSSDRNISLSNMLSTSSSSSSEMSINSSAMDPSSILQGAMLASSLQSKIRALVCVDGDSFDIGTLRLLHSAFGAGVPKIASSLNTSSLSSPLKSSDEEKKSSASKKKKNKKDGEGGSNGDISRGREPLISSHSSTLSSSSSSTSSSFSINKDKVMDRSLFMILDEFRSGSNEQEAIRMIEQAANNNVSAIEEEETAATFSTKKMMTDVVNKQDQGDVTINASSNSNSDYDYLRSYRWSSITVNSLESQSSPAVFVAVNRGGQKTNQTQLPISDSKLTASSKMDQKKLMRASSSSSSSSIPTITLSQDVLRKIPSSDIEHSPLISSFFSNTLRDEIKAQYVQTISSSLLPSTSSSSLSSTSSSSQQGTSLSNEVPLRQSTMSVVECVGLHAHADEAFAIIKTIKTMLSNSSSSSPLSSFRPKSIAVMCRSNSLASELGIRLQSELTQEANVFASSSTELWRVPELKWLIALMGVLVQPRDQTNWYLLLSSPLYRIPLPIIADWVRSAVSDKEQSGSMLRVLRSAAAPENLATKGASFPRKTVNAFATAPSTSSFSASSTSATTSASETYLVSQSIANAEDWRVGLSDSEDESRGPLSSSSSSLSTSSSVINNANASLNRPPSRPPRAAHQSIVPAGTSSDSDDAAVLPPATDLDFARSRLNLTRPPHHHLLTENSINDDSDIELDGTTSTSSSQLALSVRKALDDLSGFMTVYEKFGSVARALVWFVKRSPKLADLLMPATVQQADSAAAVTALLVLAQRLELPCGGSGMKSSARRFSGQFHAGPDDAPLASLPIVYEALRSTVYTGKLRFVSGSGGDRGSVANSLQGNPMKRSGMTTTTTALVSDPDDDGDSSEEVIDIITSNKSDLSSSATSELFNGESIVSSSSSSSPSSITMENDDTSQTFSDIGESSTDAVLSSNFAQIEAMLADKDAIAIIDAAIDSALLKSGESNKPTEPLLFPMKRFLPSFGENNKIGKPSVFVTTIHKGKEHSYDVVILPGCSNSAFPGRFISSTLPVPPEDLFSINRFIDKLPNVAKAVTFNKSIAESTTSNPIVRLPPTAYSKEAHDEASRKTFFEAVACARDSVMFFCPGRPTPDTVSSSSRMGRSKWLDSVFGPPPPLSRTLYLSSNQEHESDSSSSKNSGLSDVKSSSSSSLIGPTSAIGLSSPHIHSDSSTPPSSSSSSIAAKPLSLSFSSISDYEWCPQKYKLRKIDKLLPLPASNLEYGKALHAAVAACAEIVARPLYVELERSGAIQSWSKKASSSPSSGLVMPSPLSSLDNASVALRILRGGGGGGAFSQLTSKDIQDIRAATLKSLPSLDTIIKIMTSAYQASWVPEVSIRDGGGGGESASSSLSSDATITTTTNNRVAWAAAYPTSTGLPEQVRDGSASDDPNSYVRAAVDGLLLNADEVRGYEESARTAIRNFAERELFEMKRLLSSDDSNSYKGGGGGGVANIPLSLPALLEQFFAFSLDEEGNIVTNTSSSSPSSSSPLVKMTGYIDRVDVAAVPAEQSARYYDGQDTMEVTIREFKSGQHWKYQRSAAFGVPFYCLKDKLKTLQPDIYGIAVSEMLRKRDNRENNTLNRLNNIEKEKEGYSSATTSDMSVRVAIESIELGSSEGKLINDRVTSLARAKIVDVAKKIKSERFDATPGEMACTYCGFNNICEFAFKQR